MVAQTLDPAPAGEETPPGASTLKVAFMGSHGVGKTTLCFELAARLKRMDHRVDMVKEVARSCPLPLNRDTTVEAQTWILFTQIAREIETSLGQEVVVCDRSVLDNYAYLVAKYGRLEPYDSVVSRWLQGYALLVWVPVIEDPRFDGVRDTDRSYQRLIDDLIGEMVEAFSARPLRLQAAQREQWIEQVIDALPLRSLQLPLF